jgi:hypothetical protein
MQVSISGPDSVSESKRSARLAVMPLATIVHSYDPTMICLNHDLPHFKSAPTCDPCSCGKTGIGSACFWNSCLPCCRLCDRGALPCLIQIYRIWHSEKPLWMRVANASNDPT